MSSATLELGVGVGYMLLVRYARTEGSCDYTVVMYSTRSDVTSTAETLRGGQGVKLLYFVCSGDLHEDAFMPWLYSVALITLDT